MHDHGRTNGSAGPPDRWLVPVLYALLSREQVAAIEHAVTTTYWDATLRVLAIDDTALVASIARRYGIRVAEELGPACSRNWLDEEFARRYHVLAISASPSSIEIATANPCDFDCERTIAFATGKSVRLALASPARLARKIDEVYSADRDSPPDVYDAENDGAAEVPIVRLVDRIVSEGIAARASDIHLEQTERGVVIRFRIDGVLRYADQLPHNVGMPLVSRIKIMARLDIADRLRPQGGHAAVTLNGTRIDLRVSTLPAAQGEKVVIRVLDTRTSATSLGDLGLEDDDVARFRRILDLREGLVLVTGPTGSGKTTTLYAALRAIQRAGLNIVTVEDPVEYRIPGIVQVQTNERAGLTFASALRSILRQDPDVVLIGEIRDGETAAIAVQAALTGHLVFATLHTNDACSSITRMADLGIEAGKLSAALKAIIAQRLIRRLCRNCRVVANAGAPQRLRSLVAANAMVYTSSGCDACGFTGFRGRLALMEIILCEEAISRAISANSPLEMLAAAARGSGARSLWDAGVARLVNGDTSGDELMRVLEVHGGTASRPNQTYHSADELHEAVVATPVTEIRAAVVDVYVLRQSPGELQVLAVKRAVNARCPGAWETIHGRLEGDELPEEGARREVREETGLEISRLYNVTVQPFYLHNMGAVQLAIVFAAFVELDATITLGEEHQACEWLGLTAARDRFAWPREREALQHIAHLLGSGDAGSVEDVLRVY